MPQADLVKIVACCDRLLQPETFQDWEGARNGLQVANRGRVTRIAAAVDASLTTVRWAVEAKADLLVVHHGLFWSRREPWTGPTYELLRCLIEHQVAVYSAHLPLDVHPKLGNNALFAQALGLRALKPFFHDRGRHLGCQARGTWTRDQLAHRLGQVTGRPPIVLPGGPERCRRVGVVTGGAGAELKLAAAEGVDTFITGEGPHWTYALAEEYGINVLYGGHYATETFGVQALAAHLSDKFDLPWLFLDHPTGL